VGQTPSKQQQKTKRGKKQRGGVNKNKEKRIPSLVAKVFLEEV